MAALLNRFTLRLLLLGATGFLYVIPASARQANQQLQNPDRPSTVVGNVQIMTSGDHQQLSISLTPESASPTAYAPPGPPILAPNAEKEITQALEELRANKSEDARRHLEKVSHAAPSHPDVSYLWGMYYAEMKDFEKAKVYW